MLYERLDRRRAETAKRLQEVLHDETVGTPQALTERDVAAGIYTDRLAALRAAEHGLAFGRLDAEDGEVRYVGRLGLLDEDDEYNSLLMDWRAPAARPFYTATAASPEGMRRRRHLRTRRREVTGIDDEILDLDAARAAGRRPGQRAHQRGRAARGGGRAAAPGGWPTSSPRSRPSRTRSSGRSPRVCWWCRAGPAPARPPWRCTGPRTCSTPTATGWPAAVCSWWGPTPRSCATSGRCCRRWARRASCSAPSGSSSRVWTRDGPSRRRSPRSRGGRRWRA